MRHFYLMGYRGQNLLYESSFVNLYTYYMLRLAENIRFS